MAAKQKLVVRFRTGIFELLPTAEQQGASKHVRMFGTEIRFGRSSPVELQWLGVSE
jgi:hypothetical protein